MSLFRSRTEKKLIAAGIDPSRLPPGQHMTKRWPVLHAGAVPKVDLATWELRVFGEVEREVRLSWDELRALPTTEITVDIHCVTRWSRFDTRFRGVHWRELAALARPSTDAGFLLAHAELGFTANMPLAAVDAPDALIAWEADGRPLTPDHGGPVRLVVASRYFWKSAKWLKGLEVRSFDTPGYWERYGYHNDADFRHEERFSF